MGLDSQTFYFHVLAFAYLAKLDSFVFSQRELHAFQMGWFGIGGWAWAKNNLYSQPNGVDDSDLWDNVMARAAI